MSRLINVDEVIKKINEDDKRIEFDLPVEEMLGEDNVENFVKLVNMILPQYKKMIMEYIEEQPTANVDKDVRAEAYNKGLEDAWELARKIFTTDREILQKIFVYSDEGYIIVSFKPQEVIEKLEAYEKEQAEIEVGDVVEIDATHSCGIVIAIDEIQRKALCLKMENLQYVIGIWYFSDLIKTGKHIDIQSALEQIGGGTSEE